MHDALSSPRFALNDKIELAVLLEYVDLPEDVIFPGRIISYRAGDEGWIYTVRFSEGWDMDLPESRIPPDTCRAVSDVGDVSRYRHVRIDNVPAGDAWSHPGRKRRSARV